MNDNNPDKVIRVVNTNTLAYRGLIAVEDLRKAGMQMDITNYFFNFRGHNKVSLAFVTVSDISILILSIKAYYCHSNQK